MKKRLFALATLMLCVVMMLSSCSLFTAKLSFQKIVKKDATPEEKTILTSAEKLDLHGSIDDERSLNDLVVFYEDILNSKKTTVYNLAKGEIICSAYDNKDVKYTVNLKEVEVGLDESVTVLFVYEKGTKDTYNITVLSESGSEIVALSDVNKSTFDANVWVKSDLLCVQDKIYRLSEDGSASEVGDWNGLRKQPINLQKAGDYYVTVSSPYSVTIYDSGLNVTAVYNTPIYDLSANIYGYSANPLSNGNVIVQYTVRQDTMAEKYDFLVNGTKYNLYTVLVKAENGKTKKLDMDYLFMNSGSIAYGDLLEELGVNEKIDNLGIAYAIEDQRVNKSESSAKILSITNTGRVKGVLEAPAPGVVFTEGFDVVAKNRWQAATSDGRWLLLNEKGKAIGEIPYTEDESADFLLEDNKIYDWDLNVKVDLNEQKAKNIVVLDHSVLFENDAGETLIYVNGSVKTLIGKTDSTRSVKYLSKGAYMIVDVRGAEDNCEIYNDQGTLLLTITDDVDTPRVIKTASNGALLLSAITKENYITKYYRVG